MVIPDYYRGREQAFVKHTLLSKYLEKLFMIVGQREKEICYVDCFAGPWQEGGTDLQDTSIAISLNIMEACRRGLAKTSKEVRFRALFVESEQEPYERLRAFLEKPDWSEIHRDCLHGDFHALRGQILDWCGSGAFAFFFVDPKGWTDIDIPTLEPLLHRGNSEYLVTFMSDFIRRFLNHKPLEPQMKRIFGDIPDTSTMMPQDRERLLSRQYLDRLKACQSSEHGRPRAAYVRCSTQPRIARCTI